MPNWCTNNLNIQGSEKELQEIKDLFLELKKKQEETDHGQLPDWIDDSNGGWFFYIEVGEELPGSGNIHIWYETKWAPNIEIIQQIADRYKVDFTCDYEESGCNVYGRAIYKDGKLKEYDLTDEFDEFEYDDDNDVYKFRDKEYDSDWEILEILLEEKIAKEKE